MIHLSEPGKTLNYVSERLTEPNVLEQAKIDAHLAKCELCEECLLSGKTGPMLCNGSESWLDKATSEQYGTFVFQELDCAKLLIKKNEARWIKERQEAGIPETLVPELRKIKVASKDTKGMTRMFPSIANTRTGMARVLAATTYGGRTARYLSLVWLYGQDLETQLQRIDGIEAVDFLFVDRLDCDSGSDWIRKKVFDALYERMVAMLPTMVTMGDNPIARKDNMIETEVFSEVKNW